MQRQVLALLLDYDNCVHNSRCNLLELKLLKDHGDFLEKYSQPNLTVEQILYRQQKINEIKEALTQLNIQSDENYIKLDKEVFEYFSATEVKGKYNQSGIYRRQPLVLQYLFPCLQAMGADGDELMMHILYLSNQSLFLEAMMQVIKDEIKTLILYIFSARQSFILDDYNRKEHGTGLAMYDIDLLSRKFNEIFEEEKKNRRAEVCYLTTADSYNDLAPGTARQQVIKHLSSPHNHVDYYNTVYDLTKFSIAYNILQHLALTHPRALVWVLDDYMGIYQSLYPLFNKHADIFLKTHCLLFKPYDGKFFDIKVTGQLMEMKPIWGAASFADNRYQLTFQKIVDQCTPYNERYNYMDSANQLTDAFFAILKVSVAVWHNIQQSKTTVKMNESVVSLFLPDKVVEKKNAFINLELEDDDLEFDPTAQEADVARHPGREF